MRKIVIVFGCVVALICTGCVSTLKQTDSGITSQTSAAPVRQYTIIDSKTLAMGIDIPRWYEAAGTSNEKVKELYPNTEPVIVQRTGASLDGVRLLAEGFDVNAQLAAALSTEVVAEGGRTESGDKDKIKEIVERFTAVASQAKFSGLRKEADFWVLRKYNSDGKEEYLFTVLYLMPKALYDQQVNALVDKMPDADKAVVQPLVDKARQTLGRM